MRKKLVCLFIIVVLALVGLSVYITWINASEGTQYKKQVLSQSQQKYDSKVIPFKRGDIKDRNGSVLATSEKVYKIILDCKVVNSDEDYIEPTVKAMVNVLGLDEETIRAKLENEETKDSQYQIMQSNVSITTKKEFEEYTSTDDETLTDDEKAERKNIKGVWFEEDYLRVYPLGSLACDLIGFTYSGDTADWGIEGYYSSTLNGVNGRQYGYFNDDADVEQTIIEPTNGYSVVSTIDVNIQQIVEKHIQNFMDGMAYGPTGDEGAANVGVIVADPNSGEILAMASSDPYDLNNPRNLEDYYTEEEIEAMDNEETLDALYALWRNYCISDTFEPGSTVKPLTIAAALDSGAVKPSDSFECDGYQMFGTTRIRCSIYPGAHGDQTLADALKNSCNDALMQIAEVMGPETFLKYQKIFNLGSATGIDLPGEATGILNSESQLSSRSTELASASFGQGYTCTMIQELAAFSSVINGGYYYQPHVVSKILDEDGKTVENKEAVVLKQTVSSEVSSRIRQYLGTVMESNGTGYAAKVDGYSMGGKTGTAQKLPREDKTYLVSFIGFAPLDHPQVVVYVVVDEPNTDAQADSKYAQYLYKQIMTELLPYMNIFSDEEVTGKESGTMVQFEAYIDQMAVANREKREAIKNGTYYTTGEPSTGTEEPDSEDGMETGIDDTTVAEPPDDESETVLDNKQESEGISNSEAELQNGN